MRPLRLELEGFLAYRDRTSIEFDGVDLFVLEGATGSGKSSVIDGMIFALYGTIPRLGNRAAVAPVINATVDSARVSFDFTIGDDVYTVARRVDRTAGGATVTEARLQEGDRVLESGSKEVTGAVADLLGLEFEHFIKAVVLPQGAFADFLTDTPGKRQELLRALLDLGLFEKVKVAANERAATIKGSLQTLADNLEKLEVPADEDLLAANSRLDTLEAARGELSGRLSALAALKGELDAATSVSQALSERIGRLVASAPPKGHETLLEDLTAAKTALATADESVATIDGRLKSIQQSREKLPADADLTRWVEAGSALAQLQAERNALDLAALEASVSEAKTVLAEARLAHETLKTSHAAHEIRSGLAPGDTCPVCGHTVEGTPAADRPTDAAIGKAASAVDMAEKSLHERTAAVAAASGQEQQMAIRIAELEQVLEASVAAGRLDDLRGQIEALTTEARDVEAQLAAAGDERDRAAGVVAQLDASAEQLRNALIEARAGLKAETPPETGAGDAGGWREFDEWRLGRVELLTEEKSAAGERIESVRSQFEDAEAGLGSWLESLDIVPSGAPETDLALACERQRRDVAAMQDTLESAQALGSRIKEESARHELAASLGKHLKSNNFEAWVMAEALQSLVRGANGLLADLSAGAYSLDAEKTGFVVVDHRNADLRRTTRSLSGGEVFLVSLSLALSMASQLANLTGAASRLESVFLDEGFGTLDAESLDTVAAVLDQLVVEGRTVGIVTHVKELAERIPVRFEVVKGPHTSTIRRRDM